MEIKDTSWTKLKGKGWKDYKKENNEGCKEV